MAQRYVSIPVSLIKQASRFDRRLRRYLSSKHDCTCRPVGTVAEETVEVVEELETPETVEETVEEPNPAQEIVREAFESLSRSELVKLAKEKGLVGANRHKSTKIIDILTGKDNANNNDS